MVFIARLDAHGDGTVRGKHDVYAVKGFRALLEEAKAIFLFILINKMDFPGPWSNFDFAAWIGRLFAYLNGSRPGQGLFSCLCCTCCSHVDSPFFREFLLSAGPETWVSEEPEQSGPLSKVCQSVPVF